MRPELLSEVAGLHNMICELPVAPPISDSQASAPALDFSISSPVLAEGEMRDAGSRKVRLSVNIFARERRGAPTYDSASGGFSTSLRLFEAFSRSSSALYSKMFFVPPAQLIALLLLELFRIIVRATVATPPDTVTV